jgi:hypothetical protein
MNIPYAYVFYEIDGKVISQYIIHGFYGQDIRDGNKMMLIVDPLHAEIIFTNEKFSISCFFEESRFTGKVESQTQIAYITGTKFREGEYYNIHALGFYATNYITTLPNINAAIREYDDLLLDANGIKTRTDNAFINATSDIYFLLERTIADFESMLVEYRPTFARTALPAEAYVTSRTEKINGSRISIYDNYHKKQDDLIICGMDFTPL